MLEAISTETRGCSSIAQWCHMIMSAHTMERVDGMTITPIIPSYFYFFKNISLDVFEKKTSNLRYRRKC